MKRLLRALVASPKIPHVDSNYDITFDLAYITPRIIVSSGPVSDGVRKWYRYPVEDLIKVLMFNHGDNWHIWNLRGEKKGYDDQEVFNNMSYYPFPDHQPPSFGILLQCCMSINRYLNKDPRNVALIHCKAGKGRSGTIACGYIMYEGSESGNTICVEDVNRLYTTKRMRPGAGMGVSIKSQLRYLKYWERYLNLEDVMKKQLKYLNIESPTKVDITGICLKNGLKYGNKENVSICVQGYVPSMGHGAKSGVQIADLWELNNDSCRIETNGDDIDIIPKLSVSNIIDFKVSINHILYVWYNVIFETFKENMVYGGGDVSGVFVVPFEGIDGFKGTQQTGRRLFDELSVGWRFSIPSLQLDS